MLDFVLILNIALGVVAGVLLIGVLSIVVCAIDGGWLIGPWGNRRKPF